MNLNDSALEELKAAMQYIYNYLLAVVGHNESLDIYGQSGSTRSQMACDIEIIPTDQVLTWSMTQFGVILYQANKFNTSKVQAQL